ncbi:MAG: FadR family transcriptional regulator [SAR324 cluster bacterium]|nr:FadR family transcriptional regulator [SAR324 cluster bacterium]
MFKPVKGTRVYEEIVTEIKNLISEGKLKSGDQLPTERELSETFRVSRTSVREAFRILESQGLLEIRQGHGTYIAPKPVESLVQPLASILLNEKDNQIDLFEMRRLIEPQLALLAAERATPEEIAKMENILKNQEAQIARGDTGIDADKKFHYALAEATKNAMLLHVVNTIMEFLVHSRDSYLQVKERPQKSLIYHKKILSAIKERDRELAVRTMREHIEDIEKKLFGGSKKLKNKN